MSVTAAELDILINGDNSGATKAIGDTDSKLGRLGDSAGSALGNIQAAIGGIGLAADGILASTVSAFASFDSMTTKIQNNTTMTDADANRMKSTIKGLADESNVPLQQLGDGYMHITNFGFNAANATDILTAAMKSASSTGGDTSKTAETLAGTMKEFAFGGKDASAVMDVLHETAARGNMTLEQYVSVSGKLNATAAAMHIPLTDVSAAMATLTQHGIPAAQASTQLVGAINQISKPSQQAEGYLAKLSKASGVDLVGDFSVAGLSAKGLSGVMADLQKVFGNNTGEIEKLIPGLRGGLAAMVLAGTGANDYKNNILTLNDALAGKITPTEDAWARRQKNLDFQVGELKNKVQILAINIGSTLMPAVMAILGPIEGAIDRFTKWGDLHPTLIRNILLVVGAVGTLVGGLAAVSAVAGMLGPVLGPVITVLGGAVAPIVAVGVAALALYQAWRSNWLDMRQVVTDAWGVVKPIFEALKTTVLDVIKAFEDGGPAKALHTLWDDIGGVILPGISQALRNLFHLVTSIPWQDFATSALDGLMRALTRVGGLALRLFTWLKGELFAVPWLRIWEGIQNIGDLLVKGLQAVANLALRLTEWLKTEWQKINWATVWGDVTKVWDTLRQSAIDATKDVQKQLEGIDWVGFKTKVGDAGLAVKTAFGPDVLDGIVKFMAAVQNWTQTLAPPFIQAWHEVNSVFDQSGPIFQQLTRLWAELSTPQVLAALKDIGVVLGVIALIITGTLMGAITGLVTAFADALPGAIRFVSGTIEMLTGVVQILASVITGVFNIIIDLIHGDWSKAWQDFQTMLSGVWSGVQKLFEGYMNSVLGLFQAWIGGVIGLVGGFVTGFLTFIGSLVTGGGAKFEELKTTVIEKVQYFVTEVPKMLDKLVTDFESIAEQVVEGFKSGVTKKWDDLTKFMSEHFGDLPNKVKGFLGIHSPSTEFTSIGEDTDAGFIRGVDNGWPAVETSLGLKFQGLTQLAVTDAASAATQAAEAFNQTLAAGVAEGLATADNAINAAARQATSAPSAQGMNPDTEAYMLGQAMKGSQAGAAKWAPSVSPPVAPNLPPVPDLPPPPTVDTSAGDGTSPGDPYTNSGTRPDLGPGLLDQSQLDAALSKTSKAKKAAKESLDAQIADLAATFPDELAQAITDNGGKPSAALYGVISHAFEQSYDLARGGSQELGQTFADALTQAMYTTDSPVTASFVKVFSHALEVAGQTLQGGSDQLAHDFAGEFGIQVSTLGALPSEALLKFEADTVGRMLTRFGPDGQATAAAFIGGVTGYIHENGGEPSAEMLKTLAQMYALGEASMHDGGEAIGDTFLGANQAWVAKYGSDMPPALQAAITKALSAAKPTTEAGVQKIIDAAEAKFEKVKAVFGDTTVTDAWVNNFSAASQHIAEVTGSGLDQATTTFGAFIQGIDDQTGQLPSGHAVANYGKLWAQLLDTTHGGGQAVLDAFMGVWNDVGDQTGQILPDTVSRIVSDAMVVGAKVAGDGGQSTATAFTDGFNNYIDATGTAPTDAIAKLIGTVITTAGVQGAKAGPAAAQQIIDGIINPLVTAGLIPTDKQAALLTSIVGQLGGLGSAGGRAFVAALSQSIQENGAIPTENAIKDLAGMGPKAEAAAKLAGENAGKIAGTSFGEGMGYSIDASGHVTISAVQKLFDKLAPQMTALTGSSGALAGAEFVQAYGASVASDNGASAGIVKLFGKFSTQLAKLSPQAAQTAATDFNNTLAASITATGGPPSDSLAKLFDDLSVKAAKQGTALGFNAAQATMNTMAQAITDTGDLPAEALVSALDTMLQAASRIAGPGGENLGQFLNERIGSYIRQTGSYPTEAMLTLIGQIITKGVQAGDSGATIGRAIDAALAQGIAGGADDVLAALTDIGKGIDAQLKDMQKCANDAAKSITQSMSQAANPENFAVGGGKLPEGAIANLLGTGGKQIGAGTSANTAGTAGSTQPAAGTLAAYYATANVPATNIGNAPVANHLYNPNGTLKTAVSGGTATITVPAMAQGSIVNSPTLALIGEAGAEAIVPKSHWGGIGGSNPGPVGPASAQPMVIIVEVGDHQLANISGQSYQAGGRMNVKLV